MQHEVLRTTQAKPAYRPFGEGQRLVDKSSVPTRYTVTRELPVGTQARLMQAALFSQSLGHPINALLTINAAHLQRIGEGGVFSVGTLWDGLQALHELVRKWLSARNVVWAVIWSREYARCGSSRAGGRTLAHRPPPAKASPSRFRRPGRALDRRGSRCTVAIQAGGGCFCRGRVASERCLRLRRSSLVGGVSRQG